MGARSRILGQLSLAHKSGRVDDAWARIRTWEPLREGILSPSPLTRLGYPRASREDRESVKPFPFNPRPIDPWEPLSSQGQSRERDSSDDAILHCSVFRGSRAAPE